MNNNMPASGQEKPAGLECSIYCLFFVGSAEVIGGVVNSNNSFVFCVWGVVNMGSGMYEIGLVFVAHSNESSITPLVVCRIVF